MLAKEAGSMLKFSDLRVRKPNLDDLPFFRRHTEYARNNFFIIDLENQLNETPKPDNNDRIEMFKKKITAPVNEDAQMEDLEVVGEPLEISMLSQSCMDNNTLENPLYKGYHSGVADEASSLDINPMSVKDALHFFHNFEFSDVLKNHLLKAMKFTDKFPKTYALNFFANGDNPQECAIGFMLRFVDEMKYAGIMNHYGFFNQVVRDFVNYKLLAQSEGTKIRSVNYRSCYNSLCNSQIISAISKWPKFGLQDVVLNYKDEVEEPANDNEMNIEFIPGIFSIRTNWTGSASATQDMLEEQTNNQFPVTYFEKPGGLFDTVVTVMPGWLDNRVKGFERSVHLRFLMHLCDCLEKQHIVWPSQREQPELLNAFSNYVASLSAVENKQSYDFVEGLWDFLCCCRSLASVRAILKQTYEYYMTGVLNSKYVHVDNTSQTALILKTADTSNAIIPRLDEWTCVETIIQVGADRIRRDLINELINKKRFVSSSFNESLKINTRSHALERVNIVLKMHLILQSVNMISEYVTLQSAEMQNVFNMLLSQFSKFDVKTQVSKAMLNEKFDFDTKICKVESFVLEISHLREWSVLYDFSDKSGVRSSYTIHLTRFFEFKNLVKEGFSRRIVAQKEVNQCNEKLYWENFNCCTFSYGQKNAFSVSSSSQV